MTLNPSMRHHKLYFAGSKAQATETPTEMPPDAENEEGTVDGVA